MTARWVMLLLVASCAREAAAPVDAGRPATPPPPRIEAAPVPPPAPAPVEPPAPRDFATEVAALDETLRGPPTSTYRFGAGGAHPHVAWFPAGVAGRSFVAVLFSTGHDEVKAFLLADADEVWALGREHAVSRADGTVCVWQLGAARGDGRTLVESRWCGEGQVLDLERDGDVEVLTRADGGATLLRERGGVLNEVTGADACALLDGGCR